MAENFLTVCDMLLKFHNLSAKFACNFNDYIIHRTKNFLSFYSKLSKQDALPY